MVEPGLGPPVELDDRRWDVPLAGSEPIAHVRPVARVVGCLAQHMADEPVAGLGDPAAVAATARLLGRHEAHVGHELAGAGEAAQVARLGGDRDRGQEADAPDRLERGDELGLGSGGRDPHQGSLEPLHPLGRGAGDGAVVLVVPLVLGVIVPGYDVSPGTLLPLLGAVLAPWDSRPRPSGRA